MVNLPVVLVHGYKYDPFKPGKNNPCDSLYPHWNEELIGFRTLEYEWYSAGGWSAIPRAWFNGYRNTYRWAYSKLAPEAAENLYYFIRGSEHPVDLICHSLGSRVALKAIEMGAPVRTCIILSGAELCRVARPVAMTATNTRFWNVLSWTDAVIDYLAENLTPGGGGPAIGNDGLKGIPNWHNVVLDSGLVKEAAQGKGWSISGDNTKKITDHRISHEWTGNWDMYRAMLQDSALMSGIPDIPNTSVD